MRLAVIAGRGDLPKSVVAAARENDQLQSIIALKGFADPNDFENAKTLRIGELGGVFKFLKKNKISHICFCGNVERPDFSSIKPDLKGMLNLPGVVKAARDGDDTLLRHLMGLFEKEGFEVVSPQEICAPLLMQEGVMGAILMDETHREDALAACHIAQSIGALDIGQGAVVAKGITLAVEAQEGTDAMLMRVSALPKALRGTEGARRGVLAKMVKPIQDQRVDLPVIGLTTIENVSAAGLAGIVLEAEGAIVLDKEAVIKCADENNIFILGLPSSEKV